MRFRALALLAVALTGCPKETPPVTTGTGTAATPAPKKSKDPPPKLAPEAFIRAPADRVAKARELVNELRDAIVKKDMARAESLVSGGDLLSTIGQELVAEIVRTKGRIRLEPLCPAGDGLFVRFVAIEEIFSKEGHGTLEAYAGPDGESGKWKLFLAGPREAIKTRLKSETAHVRIDPAAGTLSGVASLTLNTGGERWVPIGLDLLPLDPEDAAKVEAAAKRKIGFKLTGFEVDGQPGRFQVVPGVSSIVAELSTSQQMVTVRVGYEGAPTSSFSYVTAKELVLHDADAWIPLVGVAQGGLAELDVTIESPDDYTLVMEGDPTPVKTGSGWVSRRSVAKTDRGMAVFGRPTYALRRITAGNLKIVLAAAPDRPKEELDDLEAGIRAVHEALAVVGEPPAAELRIIESTPPSGVVAVGGRSFMALGPKAFRRSVVAHELAHSWFGGLIPNTFKGEWGGAWPECMAEFVTTWALDETRARAQRTEWAANYSPVFGDEESIRRTLNFRGAAEREILYSKGPLLLAALERRIGHAKMEGWLARFVRERAHTPSDWSHIAAAVRAEAGDAEAAWLEKMLGRSGAPTFEIEGISVKDGTLSATLIQRREDFSVSDISEEIELGFVDENGKRVGELAIVQTSKRKAPFTLAVPAGAKSIEIDPEVRYPWKRHRTMMLARYPLP